jgi:S-DNA-T family DNA segregation ATPase FtsK/SpoIIIE
MPKILSEGPRYGVYALCLDEDERLLPEECRTAIRWTGPSRIQLMGGGLDGLGEVLADQVSVAWCERLARALAPIRDVSRDNAGSGLPTAARLLSILGIPDPEARDIEQIWAAGGRTTEAPIGLGTEGVFAVDISRDGPHALIAGTTGAGKSELLQTMIASLAVRNRPDTLTFVLIDYKGGSAFLDCARLPHTVGMVSDLDAHLTKRALASLAAELKRREEILFRAKAKDIEEYWDKKRIQPELAPMPRLVLIIDEFAALFAELPEFIVGLVDIARRGRSLGVHLVLATQRPAGVVSADIRANTNLRIALRVTSADESNDVIDSRDAADIAKSTPGRCYVRSGASALVGVQAGRVGGRRPAAAGSARPQPMFAEIGWNDLGRPAPRPKEAAANEDDLTTDLQVLVDAINGATAESGIAPQPSPWLEPLPELFVTDDLPAFRPDPEWEVPPVAYGMLDLPSQQTRGPLLLDIVNGGHLMIIGASRSGRSTMLRTAAAQLASSSSPGAVHIYAFDNGANTLLPLVSLPHTGAVVTRDQPERVDRLVSRLLQEVSRRQQLFATLGVSSLAEQRATAAPAERLPWMVLMVDRWEGFISAFEGFDAGRLVDSMLRLVREGSAVGLRAIFTADRSGLTGQVSTLFEERLALRLNDPTDVSLMGISAKEVPSSMPPGRVLRPTADSAVEGQVALLDQDPSGPAQVAAIQAIGRRMAGALSSVPRPLRAMRVDPLPMRIGATEALALDPDLQPPSDLWAMVGAGRDDLTAIGIDMASEGPGFVIAGPPKSGRSSAVLTMAASLADRGVPVIAIAPRRSPLRDQAGRPGFVAVLEGSESAQSFKELIAGLDRYVVAVDDCELLYDGPLDGPLSDVLRAGMDGGCGILAAGSLASLSSQYRGFVMDARKTRSGLILNPQTSSDGDILGVRLPRNAGGGPLGRGLLVRNGEVELVQVAAPDPWNGP